MAQFTYNAVNREGKRISGVLEKDSKESAIEELKLKGYYVLNINIEKESVLRKEIEFGKIIKLEELVVFTRQLATIIKAGVPILDCVYILKEQTTNKRFKRVLIDIEKKLRSGESFSYALESYPKVFPAMFINMVKAGETAGNLDETLTSVADFYEKENNTRKKVKSALTYPIIVGIIAILVTIFLLVSIVPNFVEMYAEYGAELPLATRTVINTSDFIINFWYLFVILIIAIVLAVYLFNRTEKGKYYLDYYKLKIPIFGKLIHKSLIARFSRTLGSLIKSAVPILESLTMVSQVVSNEAIAKPIREAKDSLRQGESLHEPLEKHWVFPPLLTRMVAIGEETGSLEEMLNKVADFYESDVDTLTDQLKALIEPLLIVFLAVVVGIIILAIITPMFGIYDLIG